MGKVVDITLVESDDIGIVGVGEATIPPIINFNNALGFTEAEFLRETQGSIKLGIQFENWGKQGDAYMHAFGNTVSCLLQFPQLLLRSRKQGVDSDLWDFSLNYQAAKANKFAKMPTLPGTDMAGSAMPIISMPVYILIP